MLLGKNIIVTGTARGMGRQMVETFADNGANIWAMARSQNDEHKLFCEEVAKRNHVFIEPVYFDITDHDSIKNAIKHIHSSGVPVDGLVNNAGITYNALFQMTSIEEIRKQFEVNFFAPFYLTQLVTKLMIRQHRGSIVNISSSAAVDGNSGKSAYGAAKAALITMTKCISEELASQGIRANAVCPGVTDTDMLKTMPEHIISMQKEDTFLNRIGEPIDIANTVMYLLSDYSSYITGQVIRVDGGVTSYKKRI